MSKARNRITWGIVALVVLLIVLKVSGAFGKNKGIKVTAEKVQRRNITEVVTGNGKVYPVIEVKVSSDNSGEITELDVREGDTVKKGQVLARIYADIYTIQRDQASSGVAQSKAQVANEQATIDALQAQLDQSKSTYEMQQKLHDEKVISENEFNIAQANYKSALANYNAGLQTVHSGEAGFENAKENLEKANKDLSRTTITAPMDGVVTLLNVKKGEKIVGNGLMAGTELLRIADLSQIEVRADVNENDVPKLKLGDSAIVNVDAYPNHKFRGIVTQISNSNNGAATESDQANASTDVTNYKVYVLLSPQDYINLLDNGRFPFKPGMNASADIQTQTDLNVLSVPIGAVTTRLRNDTDTLAQSGDVVNTATSSDDLDEVVFVVGADNHVRKVKVNPSIQDLTYMEITDGLKENDEVVTGPYSIVSKVLKDSSKIQVVDKKDPGLFDQKIN